MPEITVKSNTDISVCFIAVFSFQVQKLQANDRILHTGVEFGTKFSPPGTRQSCQFACSSIPL